MPFFLIVFGLLLIIVAVNNNQGKLGAQLGTDFQGGLFKWMAAMIAVGAIGFIPGLKGFARGIIGLIILVFLLKNGKGLFSGLQSAITGGAPASEGSTPLNTIKLTAPGSVIESTGGGAGGSNPGAGGGDDSEFIDVGGATPTQ